MAKGAPLHSSPCIIPEEIIRPEAPPMKTYECLPHMPVSLKDVAG